MALLPGSSNLSKPSSLRSNNRSRSIAKLSLLSVTFLFIFAILLFLLCIFMSMSLGPQAPVVEMDSLFVSKLNASNTKLAANWDIMVTMWNPSLVSKIYFNRVEGLISYRDTALSINSIEPFALGLKEQRAIRMRFSTTGFEGDQPFVKERVSQMIRKEYEGGLTVSFNMQIMVWATYTNGWWGTQRVMMNPRCDDMRVAFLPGGIGFGRWLGENPMTCSVHLLAV